MNRTQAVIAKTILVACSLLLFLWVALIGFALTQQTFIGPSGTTAGSPQHLDLKGGTVVHIRWFAWLIPVTLLSLMVMAKRLAIIFTPKCLNDE